MKQILTKKKERDVDYNFFAAIPKQDPIKKIVQFPYFFSVVLLLLALIATAVLFEQSILLSKQAGERTEVLSKLKASSSYAEAKDLSTKTQEIKLFDEKVNAILQKIQDSPKLSSGLLSGIVNTAHSMPIIISSVKFEGDTMTAVCILRSGELAPEFITALKQNEYYSDVDISSTSGRGGDEVSVVLYEKIKAGEKK